MNNLVGKFHLEISEPNVVMQGAVGDQNWGHYQFPSLRRTVNGGIQAHWSYNDDDIDYKPNATTVILNKISEDNGETWRAVDVPERNVGFMMPNGKYFVGFRRAGAHAAEYISKYTPAIHVNTKDDKEYYFAEDIAEDEDKRVWASEADPVTGETTEFECKVNWPNLHLAVYKRSTGDMVYPTTMVFALHGTQSMIMLDGVIYILVYGGGFDAEAKREDAIGKYMGYTGVYVLKSADCGRTWDYVSQLQIDDDTFSTAPKFEGFGEPKMIVMPDGSVVMLMRSGWTLPSYITRSTDNCKTWSKPQIFDECGVFPRMLTLGCGVTLASYGRPVLRVRATGDPAGVIWEEPIQLPLYSMKDFENPFQRSCFYTDLFAIDDTTALLIYTDFRHPNADGEGVKSVLVRTIKVICD